MPVNLNLQNGQSFTVPEKVASLSIQMWAGGGAGEAVADNFVKTSGTNGGNTELLGLRATEGIAGRTPGGGGAGSGTTTFNWSSLGVSVSTFSGTNGTIPTRGNGSTIGGVRKGDGGGGDPGTTTYTSFSQHIFDNDSNTHVFTNVSSDLSVSYENQWAPDGLSCSPNYGTKHYRIRFNNAFTNANYSLNVYGICQQAAGGGTAGPYYQAGILDKTSSGFRIWFCNGNGKNTYIRCFSFTASGTKAGAQGMGGGGGGGVSANFTRQNLIDSGTYAPGTNHTAIVGQGGSGGYSVGSAGGISIQMLIVPEVILRVNQEFSAEIIIGQCVTLSWETTGDADRVTWTSGNITNQNLTSSVQVCPQETTTYTVVASGAGGNSDPASVTVFVFYVATASLTTPETIDYGDTLIVGYETQYADVAITVTPYYYYVDGTSSVGTPISITPAITAESGRPDSQTVVSSDSLTIPVTWNTIGPEQIGIQIIAEGRGGTDSDFKYVDVNIDRTPDNVNIPEYEDAFRDQDPVVSPQTEILSELILIDGIDIPVVVKSDTPIKVDINQLGDWKDVEQI